MTLQVQGLVEQWLVCFAQLWAFAGFARSGGVRISWQVLSVVLVQCRFMHWVGSFSDDRFSHRIPSQVIVCRSFVLRFCRQVGWAGLLPCMWLWISMRMRLSCAHRKVIWTEIRRDSMHDWVRSLMCLCCSWFWACRQLVGYLVYSHFAVETLAKFSQKFYARCWCDPGWDCHCTQDLRAVFSAGGRLVCVCIDTSYRTAWAWRLAYWIAVFC